MSQLKENQSQEQEDERLIFRYQVNGEEVKISPNIIRRFIVAPDAQVTDQEIMKFLQLCRFQKLNPFLNEAYLVKYKGNDAQLIVSKEAFMKRAESHEHYEGIEAGIIVVREGEMVDIEGAIKLPEDTLIGGWAKVHRSDRKTVSTIKIALSEFSKGQSTWNKMPMNMIRKVAVVNALRETFPESLGGMYTEDEGVDNKPKEVFDAQKEVDEKANQKFIDIQPEQKIPESVQKQEVNVQKNEDFVQQQPEPVQLEENPFANENIGQMTIDNDPGF